MTQAPEQQKPEDPFAAVRDKRTGLRSDLQITRQLTKGEPIYVVYDPVSFQAHRLSLSDYRVVSCIRDSRSLQEAFELTIGKGLLDSTQEEEFFRFAQSLETLGLLTTSNQNAEALYKKFAQRRVAERKSKAMAFLFLTLPLTNPDKFLDRTIRRFSFLFTKTAFVIWCFALFAAIAVVLAKWNAFVAPLNSILATKNLFFMSIAFVALKVWHELGHGYACKQFGGRVPEMGCKLIVGMPLAYMDATSAWSFPRRLHRILVMVGGMYFESLVAIPAAFVWAYYPDSFIGSCAYQLVFMAGVATLFFNANPLMKYDGYFILSDLLGIPNLRVKATREVNALLQRRVLGMKSPFTPNIKDRVTLLLYGVAATIYSTSLIISISALIAIRFHGIGLLLAAFQIGSMLFNSGKKLFNFLLHSDATAPVRPRARIVAGAIAVGVPLLLMLFPVPSRVRVEGVVSADLSSVVRATTAGVITSISAQVGTEVLEGTPLAQLENIETETVRLTEEIAASSALRSAIFVSREDPVEGVKLRLKAKQQERQAELARQEAGKLTIRAPHEGKIAFVIPEYSTGAFVDIGEPIATVVSGQTIVRAYLTEEQVVAARVKAGEKVSVRFADQSASGPAEVISVAPAKTEEFEDLAVTTAGEGSIPVDPNTGKSQQPMFLLRVKVPEVNSDDALQDVRASLLIGRKYESLGSWLFRRTVKFTNSIFAS